MLDLRLAHSSDIPFICQGYEQMARLESVSSGITPDEHFAERTTTLLNSLLERPDYIIIIATDDKETSLGFLVGSLSLFDLALTARPIAQIHCVFVNDASRKRGIGQQLVSTFENVISEHRAMAIDIQHMRSNETASQFWENAGYTSIAIVRRKHLEPIHSLEITK